MSKDAPKEAYRTVIQRRATELVSKLNGLVEQKERLILIEETLWQTGIESWKNGIQAGQRRQNQKNAPSA